MKTKAEKKLLTILVFNFLEAIKTQAHAVLKQSMFEGERLDQDGVYERLFKNDAILDAEKELIQQVIDEHFWEWRDEIGFDIELAEDIQKTDNSMKGEI